MCSSCFGCSPLVMDGVVWLCDDGIVQVIAMMRLFDVFVFFALFLVLFLGAISCGERRGLAWFGVALRSSAQLLVESYPDWGFCGGASGGGDLHTNLLPYNKVVSALVFLWERGCLAPPSGKSNQVGLLVG